MVIADEELVAEYHNFKQQLEQMASDFKLVITHPSYSLPFLQAGRLIKVKYGKLDFGWGAIINYQKRVSKVRLISHHSRSVIDQSAPESFHTKTRGVYSSRVIRHRRATLLF